MERFQYLFDKFVRKSATAEERAEFQQMLLKQDHDAELKKLIDGHFDQLESRIGQPDLDSSDRVLAAIFASENDGSHIPQKNNNKVFGLWLAGIAASLLIVMGVVLYHNHYQHDHSADLLAGKYIAPGTTGATLTLSNGKKIKLSTITNGELAREAGVSIKKTADGQIAYEAEDQNSAQNAHNVLSTVNGETYQVKLPDGSEVWLNSASSLNYPVSFTGSKTREVELLGEAYFEVAKDKMHPFIVKTAKQSIKVLGTHFNISSYADEPETKTTLLEGSVEVNQSTILKPGDQAVSTAAGVMVKQVDVENVIGWKNNDFAFADESFDEAMRRLARWYNVEIVYDHISTANILPGGWISRKNNISVVLKRIESTGEVHFKIEGRRVTITQ